MADKTIPKLTEIISPNKEDIALVVTEPTSDSPTNKKITLKNLFRFLANTVSTTTDGEDVVIKQFD